MEPMSLVGRSCAVVSGIVLATWAGAARADDPFPGPFPGWATFAVEARDSEPNRNLAPRGYSQDEVVRLLRAQPLLANDERVEIPWTVLVGPWRSSPGLSVAAMEVRTFRNSKDERGRAAGGVVYLAVLAGGTSGQAAVVKARASVPIDETERLESLDLAPYRITKDKVAIGVRTTRPFEGGGTDGFLTLFLAEGEKLRPVWSTVLMHFARYSAMNDDNVRVWYTDGSDKPAVVSILKSSSQGFFGLRKSWKDFAVGYTWNGREYELDVDDVKTEPSSLLPR